MREGRIPRKAPAPLQRRRREAVGRPAVVLVRAGVIVIIGVACGLLSNAFRPDGVALSPYQPRVACGADDRPVEPLVLPPGEVDVLCGTRGVVVADTRDEAAFREGHVAGAVHLPCSARPSAAQRLIQDLSGQGTVIVYGESTEGGLQTARSLLTYPRASNLEILVIEGGFGAWKQAGLACASGPCTTCEEIASHADGS